MVFGNTPALPLSELSAAANLIFEAGLSLQVRTIAGIDSASRQGRLIEWELSAVGSARQLPDAFAALLAALSRGELTTEEAEVLAGLLDQLQDQQRGEDSLTFTWEAFQQVRDALHQQDSDRGTEPPEVHELEEGHPDCGPTWCRPNVAYLFGVRL